MPDYTLELDDAAVERYMMIAQLANRAERSQWASAGIKEGAIVADIGCGPGAVTVLLEEMVRPSGWVTGIDGDPAALAIARQLAGASSAENVLFQEGDAALTGLAPGKFDVVMLRFVLGHNGGREQEIVDHLASLVRRGGSLYLVDVELTGMRIYPPAPILQDLWQRYLNFHTGLGNDVAIGLRLGDLLKRAGLELTDFRARYDMFCAKGFRGPPWEAREALSSAGFARPDDLVTWQEEFDRIDEAENPPTLFVPFFTATGRRRS